jgi:hypothetical protein
MCLAQSLSMMLLNVGHIDEEEMDSGVLARHFKKELNIANCLNRGIKVPKPVFSSFKGGDSRDARSP